MACQAGEKIFLANYKIDRRLQGQSTIVLIQDLRDFDFSLARGQVARSSIALRSKLKSQLGNFYSVHIFLK